MLPTKLSPDLVQHLFCLPLNFCAVAVYTSVTKPEAGVAPGVGWNPIWFGSCRDYKVPTTSQMLTEDLHFHYLLGKHASGLAQRYNHTFTLQQGLFLPYTDSLSTSILNWQRPSTRPANRTFSFGHLRLFWPPILHPWRISLDHSTLTINSVPVLRARGLTPEEHEEGLLSCHGGQSQQKVLKIGDSISS